MPLRPTTIAPVGKSGPLTCFISPSTEILGSSIIAMTASIVSPRWGGGMVVAIPTAAPVEPGRAVEEEVREARRKHRRLPARLVVVRLEVDGVRVDVAQQLGRDPREA